MCVAWVDGEKGRESVLRVSRTGEFIDEKCTEANLLLFIITSAELVTGLAEEKFAKGEGDKGRSKWPTEIVSRVFYANLGINLMNVA